MERILRRVASAPHTKYNKDKIEGHKLEIQEILGTFNTQNSPLDGATKPGLRLAPVDPDQTATAIIAENGT